MTKMNRVKALAGLTVLLLLVVLGIQNSQPVSLRILFWHAEVDGLLLFLSLFTAGAFTGILLPYLWRRNRNGDRE